MEKYNIQYVYFIFYTLSSPSYRSPPPDILQQNSLLQISILVLTVLCIKEHTEKKRGIFHMKAFNGQFIFVERSILLSILGFRFRYFSYQDLLQDNLSKKRNPCTVSKDKCKELANI